MKVAEKYKQTDIGIIPNDWEIEYVKNLAEIKTGSRNTQDRVDSGLYPFFVRSQVVERINSYSFDGEAVLTAGDGVGVGKVMHYINGKFDCHQRVYRISNFSEKINGYYFFLYFSNNFLNRIMQMTAKSSVDSVRMDMIADMQIPIPPTKAEQTAIATALSDADALISSLEKLIAKKRMIKQGAMQQLLQPKEGWEVKKLGEVGECHRGVSYNPERDLHQHDKDTTIRLLRSNNVQNQNIDLNGLQFVDQEKVKLNQILQDNDIVICMANGSKQLVGKAAIYRKKDNLKYTFGAFMGCYRTNVDLASSSYIAINFQSFQYRNYIDVLLSGSSINNLNPGNIESIEIPFPSPEEQTRIATVLSDMDAEIAALETKLEKYRKVKLGMMQNLLTGKIRLV